MPERVKDLEAALTAITRERDAWRVLLIDADSMLSAYGHGRVITKAEALELSGRCRVRTNGWAAMTERPKVITDLLAVDDTGVVANYIRRVEQRAEQAEAALTRLREALIEIRDCKNRGECEFCDGVLFAALRPSGEGR